MSNSLDSNINFNILSISNIVTENKESYVFIMRSFLQHVLLGAIQYDLVAVQILSRCFQTEVPIILNEPVLLTLFKRIIRMMVNIF